MAISCGEASKMLARILDEALDTRATASNDEEQQALPEPGTDGAAPDSVVNDIIINPSGNGNEALPMDSEAFFDWLDSIDWNNPTGFYN